MAAAKRVAKTSTTLCTPTRPGMYYLQKGLLKTIHTNKDRESFHHLMLISAVTNSSSQVE